MTELERLAAALLVQWRTDGGVAGGPIAVSALLDRVLPYRVARRILGIDVSEDYEALVLRLLAEEEDLVRVDPVDAADMAKATVNSRLPDLDALQLLRSATVTLTERTIARLGDVLPMPSAKEEAKPAPAPAPAPVTNDEPPSRTARRGSAPSSRSKATQRAAEFEAPAAAASAPAPPVAPNGNDVIPLHPEIATVSESKPAGPQPDFLTTVTFTPPVAAHCWSCTGVLPLDRAVKFCPFCGTDQRQPTCTECGAMAERGWKHCPDCGATL